MHPPSKTVVLAGIVLASTWGASRLGLVVAQEETKPAKSARGGLLAKSHGHQFEVFFYPTGVRVFPMDPAGKPIDASQLAGTATFYHPNSPKPWFSRPLQGTPTSLDLAIGLSNAPPSGAKVAFEITGVPGRADSKAAFTVPLEFVPQPAAQPIVAQPTTPGFVAPSPRYIYGPGYYGFGYYRYHGAGTAPSSRIVPGVPLSGYGRVPSASPSSPLPYLSGGHAVSILPSANSSNATVGPGHRDWTTGRDIPLAKPWLRPMD